MNILTRILFTVLFSFYVGCIQAAVYTFSGNRPWHVSGNWQGGIIPSLNNPSDTIIIEGLAILGCNSCISNPHPQNNRSIIIVSEGCELKLTEVGLTIQKDNCEWFI
jgi:hypothetical protein